MNNQFTSEQRKALADMLKINGTLRDQALDKRKELRTDAEKALVIEFADKKNVTPLVPQIIKLREELHDKLAQLEHAGFHLDDDELSVLWGATSLRSSIEKRLDKQVGTQRDVHKQFDSAALAIWTADTVDEAKTVVDSLLS
jgi:regulator of replication initiation timing